MPDIASIAAFLSSIKTATDIAKAINGADSSLEKAELKLKIADLLGTLADTKLQAIEIDELIHEKDQEINDLKDKLKFKVSLVRSGRNYYDKKDVSHREPYCTYCWEVKRQPIHLTYSETTYPGDHLYICPHCKNKYWGDPN